MTARAASLSVLVVLAALPAPRALASGTIVGVGTTPDVFFSEAAGVSAGGTTIIGSGFVSGGAPHAWRWTAAGGLQLLGEFPNTVSPQSYPAAISVDGSVIVGRATFGPNLETRPFRWTAATGLQNLGAFPGATMNWASGVSGDGALVVGTSGSSGFRWTQPTGLQPLSVGLVIAGLSRDGLTVVGESSSGRAAKWSAATGLIDLGQPPLPGVLSGNAVAASADGSVVVGTVAYPSGPGVTNSSAFRWTSAGGYQVIPGLSSAVSVSPDGRIVVGQIVQNVGSPPIQFRYAAIWTPWLGTRDLNTYLPTLGVNLTGWNLLNAVGISDDGRIICGTGVGPTGYSQAWVVTLAAGIPGCYANCDTSTASPVLNIADFGCFINRFAAGDPYANCDGSTAPPVLNVADFACFLNAFAAGCP
jgi:uncharacterized membrane protein